MTLVSTPSYVRVKDGTERCPVIYFTHYVKDSSTGPSPYKCYRLNMINGLDKKTMYFYLYIDDKDVYTLSDYDVRI